MKWKLTFVHLCLSVLACKQSHSYRLMKHLFKKLMLSNHVQDKGQILFSYDYFGVFLAAMVILMVGWGGRSVLGVWGVCFCSVAVTKIICGVEVSLKTAVY